VKDLDTSMLVEAGAGSGKTTSLIDRMLSLIGSGKTTVQTMAAVTFTRKAAAELKGRFQIALEAAVKEEKETLVKWRYRQALENIEVLFAGTIHSFCARLLRERPVEAGIDPDFTELEEDENKLLQKQCWAAFLEDLYVSDDPLLRVFNDLGIEPANLEPVYKNVCNYSDVEIVREQIPRPDFTDVRQRLDEYLSQAWEALPAEVPEGGWDGLQKLLRSIQRLSRHVDISEDKNLIAVLEALDRKPLIVQKKWSDKELAKRQLELHNELKDQIVGPALARWREYCHWPVMDLVKSGVEYFGKERLANSMMNFQDLLLGAAGLLRENAEVRRYFQNRFTHLLVDEFQDTDPIQAEVILHLCGEDADETSWQKARIRQGSLFVVGDPKQSIYRFRRADIDMYNEVKEIMKRAGGRILPLNVNFRSVPAICDWLNPIFKNKFPAEADRFRPAFETVDPFLESPVGGIRCVTIAKITGNPQAEVAAVDAEKIAGWIAWALENGFSILDDKQRERPARPEDFMILLRYTKHMQLYVRALELRGIPYEVAGAAGFGQSQEVGDLITLLTAVSEPEDAVALVGALRGPFYGISDDLLYRYKANVGRLSYLGNSVCSDEKARKVVEDALQQLHKFHTWSMKESPSVALHLIMDQLGIIPLSVAMELGATRTGNLLKVFELAVKLVGKGNNSFPQIIEALRQHYEEIAIEEMSLEPGRKQAVRIMNLHKAKGLEAAVVFLADPLKEAAFPPVFHIDRLTGRAMGYFVAEVPTSNHSSRVVAIPPRWDEKSDLEERYSDAEEDRLLYVATTRARQMLVVSLYEAKSDKGAWKDLYPHLHEVQALEDHDAKTAERQIGKVLPEDFKAIESDRARSISMVARSSYAARSVTEIMEEQSEELPFAQGDGAGKKWGNVIHKALQILINDRSGNVIIKALVQALMKQEGMALDQAGLVRSAIEKVLSSSFWQRLKKSSIRYTEIPFSLTNNEGELPTVVSGIIDVAFREDDGWVIADYKSNRDDGNIEKLIEYYKCQLEMYKKVWEEITGEAVKEAGIYFTSVDNWIVITGS